MSNPKLTVQHTASICAPVGRRLSGMLKILRATGVRRLVLTGILSFGLIAGITPVQSADHHQPPKKLMRKLPLLQAPPGFRITIAAAQVKEARQMALSKNGTLFVGSMQDGKVTALRDDDQDGFYERRTTVAKNLTLPSGIALHEGDLYIGAVNQILRLADIEAHLEDPPAPQLITADLPDKTHHGWKYLRFDSQGQLLVPVGAPCNICLSKDPRFASILHMDPDSGSTRIFAEGIRNTVGLAISPWDTSLWFTDNGRDMLGDDVPAEELNHAPQAGMHFGYPFLHANNLADPKFGKRLPNPIAQYETPALTIQAHSAALGLTFYPLAVDEKTMRGAFPASWRGTLFIAEHGSWNRSSKVGYQVSAVTFVDGQPQQHTPFITGWLQGEKAWGRPNDVVIAHDGSLLISDDTANAIFRITADSE